MALKNRAAWFEAAKAYPIAVKDAQYNSPGPAEITIKAFAAAVNPVDWKIQSYDFLIETYPATFGSDVAGTVVEVGADVTEFKVGDRITGHAQALYSKQNEHGALQEYVVLPTALVCKIPEFMSFEQASVLPLAVDTAAAGLYQADFLGLELPNLEPERNGQTLIVWGGSSSVGSCATQLAHASGYEVYVTASPRNHEYCIDLGANKAFDYNDADLVEKLVESLQGKNVVGVFDAISEPQTIKNCGEILQKTGGIQMIVSVLPETDKLPTNVPGVTVKPCMALSIQWNEVGPAIWNHYLPIALESGKLRAKPDPYVIGKGLEFVQQALDLNKKGVSASKVVVSL